MDAFTGTVGRMGIMNYVELMGIIVSADHMISLLDYYYTTEKELHVPVGKVLECDWNHVKEGLEKIKSYALEELEKRWITK